MKPILIKILVTLLSLSLLLPLHSCSRGSLGEEDTPYSVTTSSHDDPPPSTAPQPDTQTDPENSSAATEESPTLPEETDSPEETEPPEEVLSPTDRLREDYNLGTCKTLGGSVSVVLLFMDDFESEWTREEIELFTQNEIKPALAFLEEEAQKYGVELSIALKKVYSSLDYRDEVITSVKDTGLGTADVLWQAANRLHFTSTEKMIEEFRCRYQTEEIVCLTVFNKDGTSYAINPKRGADIQLDEHCIVFARDLNTTQNGPAGAQAAVVAHEILHLYGAEDFYASASRKRLAQSHYPNDIMLAAAYRIQTNTVDPATAFYVGWTDTVPDVLRKNGW